MTIVDTRDKILNVANILFSRFGFHKTSMDEVAKVSRKSKGSLYYHFSSKEDLFREVVSEEIEILKNQLSTIFDNPELSAPDKMKKYLIRRMEILNDATTYHETIKADLFEHFDFMDELRAELDDWERKSLKSIINAGIESKDFAKVEDIDVLVDVLFLAVKGLEIPFFLQNKYGNYAPYFDGLMGIFTKGLST